MTEEKKSTANEIAFGSATENINEQAGTAQVINPLDNEKKTMEKKNYNSSIVPEAGASDTTLGSGVQEVATVNANESATDANNRAEPMGSTQVPIATCTEVEAESSAIMTKLPAPVHSVAIYKYRELLKSGFKPAYLKINRAVDDIHASKLANDAASSADKTFITSAKVVWAREALEAGLELIDESGNELTLESKDIDRYFVIIDGQNRAYAMHLNESIDLRIEFIKETGEDISRIIVKMNKLAKNWSGDDYIYALQKKHNGKVPLLEEIDRLAKKFKVSRKYLSVLLCNDKDKIRLRKLKAAFSKETPDLSEYDIKQDAVEFAEKVLTAIRERFGADFKATSTVMFVTALMNIEKCISEQDKMNFKENLPGFIMSLSDDEVKEIMHKLSAKDEQELKYYMSSRYNTFIQSTDVEEVNAKYSVLFVATATEEASKEGDIRKLSSGTVAQLIQNKKDLEEQKERREKERKEAREANKGKHKHMEEGGVDE